MEYLYHYTSVDSLKCILKNQTIRFKPLSTLDDMEEAASADCKAVGDFIFVSSWSAEAEEMIPMWYMYGDQFKGVRIALPKDPFIQYHYSPEAINIPRLVVNNRNPIHTYIPLSDILHPSHFIPSFVKGSLLCEMEYSNDPELLYPNVWGGDITFAYGKMGVAKNRYWSFQREWRYVLHVFPFSLENWVAIMQNTSLTMSILHNIADGIIKCPLQYYDLKLSQEAIENMRIVTGPLLSQEAEDELHSVVDDISRSIRICKSTLFGKIRS